MSDMNSKFDTIALRNLQFRCIIGIYPRERMEAQPLELDLELDLSTEKAVAYHCLEETIDYAALADELTFLLEHAHFDLLETAGHAICHFILGFQPLDRRRALAEQVRLVLRKPKALKGSAYPELIMKRQRAQLMHWNSEFSPQRYLHENANCSLMQIDLKPGEQVKFCKPADTQCYILSWTGLQIQNVDQYLAAGQAHQLADAAIIRPAGDHTASVLCVIRWLKNASSRETLFYPLSEI